MTAQSKPWPSFEDRANLRQARLRRCSNFAKPQTLWLCEEITGDTMEDDPVGQEQWSGQARSGVLGGVRWGRTVHQVDPYETQRGGFVP